ncbi:MAG: hypothetical protein M3441_23820 [Chloroflexota bacterium]|nr:hypothetical protein [Chloroflexota bacterium]
MDSSANAASRAGEPPTRADHRARTSDPTGSAADPESAAAANSIHLGAERWAESTRASVPAECTARAISSTRRCPYRSTNRPSRGAATASPSKAAAATAPDNP